MLQRVMPKVQAWERLHNIEYSGQLTMGQLYDLLIEAGYSEAAAHKAATKRGWDRLQAGVVM